MKKCSLLIGLALACSTGLTACNSDEVLSERTATEGSRKNENRTFTYFDKQFNGPRVDKVNDTASLIAMENAEILGVKPIGSITPDAAEQVSKAAKFSVSRNSQNWAESLRLMGEMLNKEKKAETIISEYKKEVSIVHHKIKSIENSEVIVITVRSGELFLSPPTEYLNPVLYQELGFKVPDEIKQMRGLESIPLDKIAEMNPDYIFLQYAMSENTKNPLALKELDNKPIWTKMKAVKYKQVFVNAVDPLSHGGTAWSKMKFLRAVEEKLVK